jgi:glutamate transport system permease protein
VGVVTDHLGLFAEGARTTAVLTALSFAFALVIGTVVAGCRVSPVPPLRIAATAYVETVRNTPLTVLFVLFFFGFPKIGITQPRFASAVIVLSAYTGAFVGEALRSGINAVASGQAEAGRALGLTFGQSLRLIVLPQAYRTVVAPLGGLLVALIKNSAIASVISVTELSRVADDLNNATARPIPVFIGAALCYLALAVPTGLAVGALERRVAIRR